MLATIASATLLGVVGSCGPGRGPRLQWPARLHHRRPPRLVVPRGARPGPGRPASSGLSWPNHRVTVNLAPSGLRKGGSGLDLAIAVGVAGGRRAGAARARGRHRLRRRASASTARSGGARRHPVGGRRPRRRHRGGRGPRGGRRGPAGRAPRGRPVVDASPAGRRPCVGDEPWPAVPPVAGRAPGAARPAPTWPTSGASPSPATPSRSPPPAATTC